MRIFRLSKENVQKNVMSGTSLLKFANLRMLCDTTIES